MTTGPELVAPGLQEAAALRFDDGLTGQASSQQGLAGSWRLSMRWARGLLPFQVVGGTGIEPVTLPMVIGMLYPR